MCYYKMIYYVNGVKQVERNYYKQNLIDLINRLEENGYYVDNYEIKKIRRN